MVEAFQTFSAAFAENVHTLVSQKVSFIGMTLSEVATASVIISTPGLDKMFWDNPLGFDLATVKFIICLFISYPASMAYRSINSTFLKHSFSLILGIFFVQWIYAEDWIHSFISVFVTYLICLFAPRKQVGALCMIWSMFYMTFAHFYRMSICYDYSCLSKEKNVSGFDFTGTQMVLTMKLSSFGFNYSDGAVDYEKEREKAASSTTDKKKLDARNKIMKERESFAVEERPNLIEYFGYMYCFTNLLAGPAFEYKDYITSVDGSAFGKGGKEKKSIPASSYFAALKIFGVSILCLIVNSVLSAFFPLRMFSNWDLLPKFIFATESMKSNMFLRYACSWVALVGERFKFYFVWKCAEGSSVLAGFGFEGYNDNGIEKGWSGVENIEIINMEMSDNLQSATKYWNKRTQQWLNKYTYNRCNQSLNIVYFVSAMWHGLYPGFFVFFMSAPILTIIDRKVKEKINPIFEIQDNSDAKNDEKLPSSGNDRKQKTYPFWYNALCWFMTSISLNYIVQFFSNNTLEKVIKISTSYHHLPHIIAFALMVVLMVFPGPSKKEKSN